MVQKYCPTCKDLIPVACKTCPCGHKFVKTVAESWTEDVVKAENGAELGRQENGRPRRRSAMNSLYYHSSLQLPSYKQSKPTSTINTRKNSLSENNEADATTSAANGVDTTHDGAVNGATSSMSNGHPPKKRRRGRPRLTPLPETDEVEIPEPETKPKVEETIPPLRRRRPGLIYTALQRSSSDLYEHSTNSNDSESKSSKSGRAIIESESFSKLYQTLSEERRKHFAYILADINFKFRRNANFPL